MKPRFFNSIAFYFVQAVCSVILIVYEIYSFKNAYGAGNNRRIFGSAFLFSFFLATFINAVISVRKTVATRKHQ